MSYIDAKRTKNDQILVWERNGDERVIRKFDAPYYFYIPNSNGEHTSIFGDKLERFDFPSYKEFNAAKAECKSNRIDLYESDIPAKFRVLADNYYKVEAPKLHVSFYDIEVDYLKEIPVHKMVDYPIAPINSLSIYHQWKDEYILIAVPPPEYEGDEEQLRIDAGKEVPLPDNLTIILCKNEKLLLAEFIIAIEDSDALCGWNSDFFDTPYIGKRLEKMDKGGMFFRRLSVNEADEGEEPYFTKPRWGSTPDDYGNDHITLQCFGRIVADYMRLFKKYEEGKYPSYGLAPIANAILTDADGEPTLPKLEYDGALGDLYKTDFPFFVRYNIRDTEILKGFEDQLGYFDLANTNYHLSCGSFSQVMGTIRLFEQAIVNSCHYDLGGLIVPDASPPIEGSGGIAGAYVLPPKVGWHSYVGSIDIQSLYPTAIRAMNISPEVLLGQFDEQKLASDEIAKGSAVNLRLIWEDGRPETMTASEWREKLLEANYSVSGYGTVFDQNKPGIIPSILTNWFNMRLHYKKLLAEARANGDTDKAAYYDKLQYTFKIKLNASYGALSNAYFRFYDPRMGESVTATGRRILRHQCAKANEALTGEYEYLGEAIVYGDTDSTYFETWTDDVDAAVKVADHIAVLVNQSFPAFMEKTFLIRGSNGGLIKAERELVSDQGIFINKKRYFLHLADKEGTRVDKLKVMGLETKKTTLPKIIADQLNKFIERLLKGEDWADVATDIVALKTKLHTTDDIMSIGLPKGVNKVEEYTAKIEDLTARISGHIAAAIHYNLMLKEYDDKDSPQIVSGTKIKVFYLTQMYGRFKSIAIPTDIEVVPSWFYDNFSVKREMHVERLVDKPLQNILTAIDRTVPTRQDLHVESLLEF